MNESTLMDAAAKAALQAWSPYSKVKVGCALRSEAGHLYTGCNVENASYGLTICAERNAIFAGVNAEGPSFRIAELAAIALEHEFPPCGACRQVIAEFAGSEVPVHFLQNGKIVTLRVAELLPATFRF
jgi:cytidine deaminase